MVSFGGILLELLNLFGVLLKLFDTLIAMSIDGIALVDFVSADFTDYHWFVHIRAIIRHQYKKSSGFSIDARVFHSEGT
jgi:hypothetical protein